MFGQGRCGFCRATEFSDVDGTYRLALKALTHLCSLITAIGMKLRIAMPVYQGKGILSGGRSGFTVANKENLGGTRRRDKTGLPVLFGFAHEFSSFCCYL